MIWIELEKSNGDWFHKGCGGKISGQSNNSIDNVCFRCWCVLPGFIPSRMPSDALHVKVKAIPPPASNQRFNKVVVSSTTPYSSSAWDPLIPMEVDTVRIQPELAKAFEGMTPEQIEHMAEMAEVVKKLHPDPNANVPLNSADPIKAVDDARK